MFIKGAPDYLLRKAKKIMDIDGNCTELNEENRKALEKRLYEYA